MSIDNRDGSGIDEFMPVRWGRESGGRGFCADAYELAYSPSSVSGEGYLL